ncbi:type II secretion system protein [Pirellulales bacterium]|nr:type II secretion system protein [Pirellulales bacterium]
MQSQPPPICRTAFTLLEVILALVILGGSVAMLSEIISLANRASEDAAAETRAQILAGSVMDQLLAGALELEEAPDTPLEGAGNEGWTYRITLLPCDIDELEAVEVTVELRGDRDLLAASYRLVRWMPADPAAAAAAEVTPAATSSQNGGNNASATL